MISRWVSVGIVASSLVGCGPTYGIVVQGDLSPELWDQLGNEPAKLYARIDNGGSSFTSVIAAYCPGDEALDQGVSASGEEPFVFRQGCMAEMEAEVWLAPDSAVPRADGLPFADSDEAALECDDRQRLIGVHPTSFTSEGWPGATVSAFDGMDGDTGPFRCSGLETRQVVLQ